ncbi:hypothetical protein CLV31_10898 [Algoriphagus aquaeductus]|uniref:Uncharacterized protein n=1 Tax=Algoriphagus aquaeductus TaxID=475299 RepID=A0A326RQV4_9BACT|nr:hypothetical protein CLV31_10898 [Algoriphagus aquaeductus]
MMFWIRLDGFLSISCLTLNVLLTVKMSFIFIFEKIQNQP